MKTKLSEEQKEIIREMRDGTSLYFPGEAVIMTHFEFLRRIIFKQLLRKKLIKKAIKYGKIQFYKLTKSGKTINL